ncbi:hypothetical protein I553_1739 [Mycobacterium xenopi 4042]|uniref:Uncharacterized protein n=1 Tax=Mycobacterium xenopi 4042 TaxID=1299334 RepID=X8DKI0_MYCXE|nr:hypothetical protein I553_1739 [Mycobacterium xenopi 4042]
MVAARVDRYWWTGDCRRAGRGARRYRRRGGRRGRHRCGNWSGGRGDGRLRVGPRSPEAAKPPNGIERFSG